MRFISAQPDDDYFVWQLQVQMNNFRKHNIEKDAVILISYDEQRGLNENIKKLMDQTSASIYVFPDKRTSDFKRYIPTIRAHLLKQYYDTNPTPSDTFYHDSDILFIELPDFNTLSKSNKLLVSDTVDYIGAKYIKSKGDGLLEEMCAIVGIDPNYVENMEKQSGGAQYFIPKDFHMNYAFWDKIEKDSLDLYIHMIKTSDKYTPSHPIQSWTADMWAILWNFWKSGIQTDISKELEFSWPTYGIDSWNMFKIFHNAGVTPDRKELFYKGDFVHKSPFESKHENVSEVYCSYKYVQEIFDTAYNFGI